MPAKKPTVTREDTSGLGSKALYRGTPGRLGVPHGPSQLPWETPVEVTVDRISRETKPHRSETLGHTITLNFWAHDVEVSITAMTEDRTFAMTVDGESVYESMIEGGHLTDKPAKEAEEEIIDMDDYS